MKVANKGLEARQQLPGDPLIHSLCFKYLGGGKDQDCDPYDRYRDDGSAPVSTWSPAVSLFANPPQSFNQPPAHPKPHEPLLGTQTYPSEHLMDGDGVDKREVTFDDGAGSENPRLPVTDVTGHIFLPEEDSGRLTTTKGEFIQARRTVGWGGFVKEMVRYKIYF